jgi:hypothetical protein
MRGTKLNLFKKFNSEGHCSNISATLSGLAAAAVNNAAKTAATKTRYQSSVTNAAITAATKTRYQAITAATKTHY